MSINQYYGLSLSERLSKAGIVNSFSAAVKVKNVQQMKTLLKSVDYSNDSADAMVNTFFNSQETYHV